MTITRVLLRPLKKTAQLRKFRASNCVFCGLEGSMLTITFEIDTNKEIMQDLAIDFSNKRIPRVYISKPYTYDNAESEV